MILARAAYPGGAAQRHGFLVERYCLDLGYAQALRPSRVELHRDRAALLGHGHRGFFFSPSVPADYHAEHKPLIDGSDVRGTIGNYEDYPELFVRWFEWGAFQPVMRAHGERKSQRSMVLRQERLNRFWQSI